MIDGLLTFADKKFCIYDDLNPAKPEGARFWVDLFVF